MKLSREFAETAGYTPQEILDFLIDLQNRADQLEKQVRQQDRTIVGLQNELIKAGKYTHDNLDTRVSGIQVLLQRAGEYKGREQRGRRRG